MPRPARPYPSSRGPLFPPEVIVRLVQPIRARRAEHIDVEGILERQRFVRHVRWDMQHLARTDDELLLAVSADPEAQRALEDVGDLLVVVFVLRHQAALLQVDVSEHYAI